MSKTSTLVGIVLTLSLALAAASILAPAAPGESSERVALSAAAARAVVVRYFHALESGRYRKACPLLGSALHEESGGAACPSSLESGMPDPLLWEILGRRATPDGTGIVVRLGQNELDHVRMRTWLAIVRLEHSAPRIVETRLLR